MNNFQKIKLMDIDEMAKLLNSHICDCCVFLQKVECYKIKCEDGIKQWLEQESEEVNE